MSSLIEATWCINASVQYTNIASDNGLSPVRHQAIIRTNVAILSIRPYPTYFNEILFKTQKFSFKEMSSVKWRPFCLCLNVLITLTPHQHTTDHICGCLHKLLSQHLLPGLPQSTKINSSGIYWNLWPSYFEILNAGKLSSQYMLLTTSNLAK